MDKGHWVYDGDDSELEGKLGILYVVKHLATNKKYVGIKQMKSKFRRPPLKGKKRKRVAWKETDWRTYRSSSEKLQAWIEEEGEDAFEFRILAAYDSKSRLAWEELKIQVENDVLRNEEWVNGIVNVRLARVGD